MKIDDLYSFQMEAGMKKINEIVTAQRTFFI